MFKQNSGNVSRALERRFYEELRWMLGLSLLSCLKLSIYLAETRAVHKVSQVISP